jgi:hypothetical protein
MVVDPPRGVLPTAFQADPRATRRGPADSYPTLADLTAVGHVATHGRRFRKVSLPIYGLRQRSIAPTPPTDSSNVESSINVIAALVCVAFVTSKSGKEASRG